jgi:hypothetical protein
MRTDEDLRQQMISTAAAFRFDQGRLDATTIARAGQQRRQRGRLIGAVATVVALTAGAGAILTQRADSPDTVVSLSSDSVYLVPTETAQNLVLRRSSQITPSSPEPYFNAFYRDGGNKRIAVITSLRTGPETSATPPRAVATSSGFWMPWSPRPGVEVNVATAGMTQQETEALFDRLGVDPARGETTYGLLTLPAGFRMIGDEDDTTLTDATTSVYATPGADIDDPQSREPCVQVTIGRASETYREIDRIIFDARTSVSIRGHEVDVVTHRFTDHGTIVTASWFERPGLLVNITTYNMTADDAVAFARSLAPATLDEWTAHRASARG